ncbi:MAG: MFS transporter [Oscillospiraceae bacterium]|nr:MFS transporter [Oscillospiraceae bacterium]
MALKPCTRKPALANAKFHYAWIIVIAVFLILGCCLGIYSNCLAVFIVTVSTELGCPIPAFATAISVNYVCIFLMSPFAGRIYQKNDVRKTVMILAVIQFIAWTLQSTYHSLAPFYVSNVVLGLCGGFLGFLLAPTLINAWFATNMGTALGIAVCGTSLGSGVTQSMTGAFIANLGWRTAYIVDGIIAFAVLELVLFFLVRSRPADIGMLAFGAEKVGQTEVVKQEDLPGLTFKEAVRKPIYYVIMIYVIFLIGAIAFTAQLPTWGQMCVGLNVAQAGVASGFNWWLGGTIGNLITGPINDKVGVGVGVTVSVAVGIVGMIVMLFCFDNSGTQFVLACVACTLIGFLCTMMDMSAPILTRTTFGIKEYTSIYSLICMFIPLISAVGMTMYTTLIAKAGNANTALLIAICCALISTVLLFICSTYAKKHPVEAVTEAVRKRMEQQQAE